MSQVMGQSNHFELSLSTMLLAHNRLNVEQVRVTLSNWNNCRILAEEIKAFGEKLGYILNIIFNHSSRIQVVHYGIHVIQRNSSSIEAVVNSLLGIFRRVLVAGK